MKRILIIYSLAILATCCTSSPRVLIKTGFGDIMVEIYSEKAPVTASNFLRYVEENRYEGAVFYRVVRMDNQPGDSIRIPDHDHCNPLQEGRLIKNMGSERSSSVKLM